MKPKQMEIDLNADLGEYQTENQYFTESQILGYVSSCNIACGGHAGDEESMKKMILAEGPPRWCCSGAFQLYSDSKCSRWRSEMT